MGKPTPGFEGGKTRQGNMRVWCYLPVMPATGRGKQEYLEFKANLDYIVSMPAWATPDPEPTNKHASNRFSRNGSMSKALAAQPGDLSSVAATQAVEGEN